MSSASAAGASDTVTSVPSTSSAPLSTSSSPVSLIAAPLQRATPNSSRRRSPGATATSSLQSSQSTQLRLSISTDDDGLQDYHQKLATQFFDSDGDGVVDMAELKIGLARIGQTNSSTAPTNRATTAPPRSPVPAVDGQSLGLPPSSAAAAPTTTGTAASEAAATPSRSQQQEQAIRARRSQASSVAVAPGADGQPPPLPPRMRRSLAAGATSPGGGGNRARSWLQAGTHRPAMLVGNTQLYCVLLPTEPGKLDSGDLPPPSGPFSLHDMARMIYSAEVTDATPVWAKGMGGWQKCSDCVARFSWPQPEVEDRSPLAGGRVDEVAHVHERLSPRDEVVAAANPIDTARELIKVAESLAATTAEAAAPQPEPEPEPSSS